VLDNRRLFRNTRPLASAGHLAGFHRFARLEPLHTLITANARIRALMNMLMEGEATCTIGLSDIAINRSLPWQVDLLRGKYAGLLNPSIVWGPEGGGMYKVMLYLDKAENLEIAKGSHRKPISLGDDQLVHPGKEAEISRITVNAGDVVVMDLRCWHREVDKAAQAMGRKDAEPGIVISTAIGGVERPLTKAMEFGHFLRMMEWWGRVPSSLSVRIGQRAGEKAWQGRAERSGAG
jgi:hypothetical protein